MATIANGFYTAQGLSVTFTDTTLGSIVSRSWDFGDGSTPSTERVVTHVYTTPGWYQATLSIGASEEVVPLTFQVGLREGGAPLSKPLLIAIKDRLPKGSEGIVTDSSLVALIHKWQIFLYDLLSDEDRPSNIYDELTWKEIPLELVTELVFYDIVDTGIKQYIISLISAMESSSSAGSGSNTSTSGGGLKKVVTGPSEVEFYGFSEKASSYQQQLDTVTKPGGVLSQSRDKVCLLSARLLVPLQICPPLPQPVFPIQIAKK